MSILNGEGHPGTGGPPPAEPFGPQLIPQLPASEIDAIVRGYMDAKLAELYRSAARSPGTEWHRLLSGEIGRRDALGGTGSLAQDRS